MRNSVQKPIKGYNNAPITLGDKIRNKRIELQHTIKQLAAKLGVTDEAVIYWEHNRGKPKVSNYPKFIEVLGFLPFDVDTSTLGGKIKGYRFTNGLNRRKFSKLLDVDETTLKNWEDNEHTPMPQNMMVLQPLLKSLT